MENTYIDQAKAAYASHDFAGAIEAYTQCLQDEEVEKAPGDTGFLYHQIGNSYLQMRDFESAIGAYSQAVADSAYDACGAVNCNMGKAYAALKDYENAVACFEIATSDAKYASRYKAHLGMGNALLQLGKNAEAGAAFREAALDPANPDPTKALLNLGVCFMALDRPQAAVQSYESALQFDMDPAMRNKMQANLGQAYVACGQMQKAMNAFEAALADKTYFLTGSASVDYSKAATAVATGTASIAPVDVPQSDIGLQDMTGLDVAADGMPIDTDMQYVDDPTHYPADHYGYEVDDGYASGDDRFFNATDEELESYSKNIARQDRKRRNVGLKILVFFFVLLLAAAAAGVYLYTQGYGYPQQQDVVADLFANTDNAAEYFVDGLADADIAEIMNEVVQDDSITIDGVDRSMSTSTVYVTASTSEGGDVNYKVSLARDMIGWKVSDVELFFPSEEQSE
ncbi:photosystem I assembly protein Ycf3 [Slackia heliotrinireducens]|uniref:Tetratricopeptide repeat protein n=1 Tax=Slackia heliotrinireducens (strain ATCC 29202 / DSM 20476 / NCTC 11029 / RHS 1) TaxID=471855 RepID=C7N4X5_SLAHD|nr:tetratricopeptide repeat protein [Slackia heliotrinireducens]ACV21960.1 tetratricopeptide repeat protein [Slackia heliotrinireducens DSM 20476]VEG99818.1 photosystem I assembly protein Ycf3 [Slackia heliotrinireducens]